MTGVMSRWALWDGIVWYNCFTLTRKKLFHVNKEEIISTACICNRWRGRLQLERLWRHLTEKRGAV
jgi:hypothetical protein